MFSQVCIANEEQNTRIEKDLIKKRILNIGKVLIYHISNMHFNAFIHFTLLYNIKNIHYSV